MIYKKEMCPMKIKIKNDYLREKQAYKVKGLLYKMMLLFMEGKSN
jgi:hypothetical protein